MSPRTNLSNRVVFNSELRGRYSARSLDTSDDITGPLLTATEIKLVRLGLNAAASENETEVAGGKFFNALRRRGISADQLVAALSTATWKARELMAARGRVMPFGRHRGKSIGEIPVSNLYWALRNCHDMSVGLRHAMELVLNQGANKR
jgi:hypothetical protein